MRLVRSVAVILAVAAAPAAAAAADHDWVTGSYSSVRLIDGGREAGGGYSAALQFRVEPGWKTYWRAPGEAGIPPEFDFSGSSNLAGAELVWPRPKVFKLLGFEAYGYADELVLPIRVTAADPAAPVRLDGQLFWGVCSDICVPEQAAVGLELTGAGSDAAAALIARALAKAPAQDPAATAICRIVGAGESRMVESEIRLSSPVAGPAKVIVEGPLDAFFGPSTSEISNGRIASVTPVELYDSDLWIGREDLRFTVLAGDAAYDIRGCTGSVG